MIQSIKAERSTMDEKAAGFAMENIKTFMAECL